MERFKGILLFRKQNKITSVPADVAWEKEKALEELTSRQLNHQITTDEYLKQLDHLHSLDFRKIAIARSKITRRNGFFRWLF